VSGEPALCADPGVERVDLGDGSWVDVARGFIEQPGPLYHALADTVSWSQGRLFRYERWVDEPRMGAWFGLDHPPPDPLLTDVTRWLTNRYGVRFDGYALAWYRNGRDGQAFHRDRDLRFLDDTLIAVLSLGVRRPWLLRPRANRHRHDLDHGGATHDLAPGPGDLLVMGGRCQDRWEHSVPKVNHPIGGRISVQWRWTSRRGRPVVGASYRAPRHFSGRG
jgi:alkylated DNA repair dioxygenase AlkB